MARIVRKMYYLLNKNNNYKAVKFNKIKNTIAHFEKK